MQTKLTCLGMASFFTVFAAGSTAYSSGSIPPCNAHGTLLQQNDSQVENWEDTAQHQFQGRAHIFGHIKQLYRDQTGHKHFSVQIGATSEDAVEIVYNETFGALPALSTGMEVEACGDFISVGRQSPDTAIVHWVHKSDTPSHDSGYVAINGVVYGQ